jgi:hypothetical protein
VQVDKIAGAVQTKQWIIDLYPGEGRLFRVGGEGGMEEYCSEVEGANGVGRDMVG